MHSDMQMRGEGHPCQLLIDFPIFSRYFICKIRKGVRKISSDYYEKRQVFHQHTLLMSLAYLPRSLTLTLEIFITSVLVLGKTGLIPKQSDKTP